MEEGIQQVELKMIVGRLKFMSLLKTVAAVADEAHFTTGPGGISCCMVDPAHIAVIDASIPKDSMEEFKSNEGVFSFEPHHPIIFMSYADKEHITMLLDGRSLRFSFERKKQLSMMLMETTDTTGITLKSFDQITRGWPRPMSLETTGRQLKEVIQHCCTISDHVRFLVKGDSVIASVEDDRIILSRGLAGTVKWTGEQSVIRCMFPAEYLDVTLKTVPDAAKVELFLDTDKPLSIHWQWDGVRYRFALAPRIDSVD